jgi:hypothetical protein
MYKKLMFFLTAILMLGVSQAVMADDCLEIEFEMSDTVYTTPGDFFVDGYFEMTNCGDMGVRVWLESTSPITSFGQIRGRVNLGAGEVYVRNIHFPVPPPTPEGEYEICVKAMVGEMMYEECRTVVVLKEMVEEKFARLQVIHNAADPAAEMVDVWVNDELLLDDFAFRTATPFVDVPAGVNLTIGVAGPSSTSPGDALATFVVNLAEDVSYVAIANGALDPSGFEANPDGMDITFSLYTLDGVREMADDMGNVDFVAFHGATDAPTVDVIARDVATIVDDLTYGYFTDYVSVPADYYILDVTPGDDNSTVVASFEAELSGLGGGAAVVFASGFLAPDDNQDGAAFGLFAALPNGNVVEFPLYTETSGRFVPTNWEIDISNYPNPFNPATTIGYNLPQSGHVTVEVFNIIGQKIRTLVDQYQNAGTQTVIWDGQNESSDPVASGIYFYRISSDEFTATRKMVLMK